MLQMVGKGAIDLGEIYCAGAKLLTAGPSAVGSSRNCRDWVDSGAGKGDVPQSQALRVSNQGGVRVLVTFGSVWRGAGGVSVCGATG